MRFYASPEAERVALRRAAARAGVHIRELHVVRPRFGAPARVTSIIDCYDGWAAARLLLALAVEDARTPGAKLLASQLREGAEDDEAFARAIQAYVKAHVAFEAEEGERFETGSFTLEIGKGDCDAHFRLAFAIAEAGGLRAALGILHHGKGAPPSEQGPAHAVVVYRFGDAWVWGETTVDADFGEPPNDAARRLGLTDERTDIAREVLIMTEDDDLPPLPEGFRERNNPAQVLLDAQALQRLGYIEAGVPECVLSDPTASIVRHAVVRFQTDQHLVRDGLLGPTTRLTIAHALRDAGAAVTDGFDYPGLAGLLGDAAPVSGPVTIKLSADIEDRFLFAVNAMAAEFQQLGARASAEDFLRVWFVESAGLHSHQANFANEPYGGLNQMGPQERKNAGFFGTFAEWLALSEYDQLPYVKRFYVSAAAGHFERFKDAPSLYVANIAPAHLSHAGEPDFPLYKYRPELPGMPALDASDAEWNAFNRTHSDPYAENRVLDRAKKGFVSVGDMVAPLQSIEKIPRWVEIQKRIRAIGGGTTPAPPSSGRGAVVASVIVTLAAAAGIAWWTFKS